MATYPVPDYNAKDKALALIKNVIFTATSLSKFIIICFTGKVSKSQDK